MKCPKCNFVSFEYLNACKKCGNDLTLHKTEMGIDFPQYASLGLIAALREESAPREAAAETATAVALDETSGTKKQDSTDSLSGTSGLEAAIASTSDFSDVGTSVELGGADALDLSGVGESADETASIKLPLVETEDLDLGADEEKIHKTPEKSEEISLDLGDMEEEAAAPVAAAPGKEKEEEFSLDLGELDLGEKTEAPPATAKKEEEFSLDLGEIESGLEVKEAPQNETSVTDALEALGSTDKVKSGSPAQQAAEPELDLGEIEVNVEPAAKDAPAAAPEHEDLGLGDLDLDINLDEITKPQSKDEKKKEDKKGDDFDLDIDLSDLKLE